MTATGLHTIVVLLLTHRIAGWRGALVAPAGAALPPLSAHHGRCRCTSPRLDDVALDDPRDDHGPSQPKRPARTPSVRAAGYALAGPVADWIDVATALWVGAAWVLVSSGLVLAVPSIRSLQRTDAPSETATTAGE